jgi:hypothetical protein
VHQEVSVKNAKNDVLEDHILYGLIKSDSEIECFWRLKLAYFAYWAEGCLKLYKNSRIKKVCRTCAIKWNYDITGCGTLIGAKK